MINQSEFPDAPMQENSKQWPMIDILALVALAVIAIAIVVKPLDVVCPVCPITNNTIVCPNCTLSCPDVSYNLTCPQTVFNIQYFANVTNCSWLNYGLTMAKYYPNGTLVFNSTMTLVNGIYNMTYGEENYTVVVK